MEGLGGTSYRRCWPGEMTRQGRSWPSLGVRGLRTMEVWSHNMPPWLPGEKRREWGEWGRGASSELLL